MKQHNRIARELASINPSWKGSLIFQVVVNHYKNACFLFGKTYNFRPYLTEDLFHFQTTRAIVTALEQIVTYDHFLPTIIGRKHMHRFGLNLVRKVSYTGQNMKTVCVVINNPTYKCLFVSLRLKHVHLTGLLVWVRLNLRRNSLQRLYRSRLSFWTQYDQEYTLETSSILAK